MRHRPGLWSRRRCLAQQHHASTRRIFISYEDARLAGETEAAARARHGMHPAPGAVLLKVRYEEARADAL